MTLPPNSDPGADLEGMEVLEAPKPFLPRSSDGTTFTIDLSRLPGAATALGVGLVSAAVAMSATYSRHTSHLDGSNLTMGVLSTLGLLGVAVAVHLVAPGLERRAALVSWPGAAGAIAVGLMLGVLITDDDVSVYVGAGAAVVLSVAGYLLGRAVPFLLGAIAGLAVLYGKIFGDVVDFGGHGNDAFMVVGAAILGFVLVVTAGGWLLPATRALTGVVVGAGGLFAMLALMEALTFATAFGSDGGGLAGPYRDDTWMILAYCAALALAWAWCSMASGHVGFRVLIVVDTVLVVPFVSVILSVDHPTWWEVVTCAAGAAVLLAAGLRARSQRTGAPTVAQA